MVLIIIILLLIPVASAAYLKEEWEKEIIEENSINDAYGVCVSDIDGDGTDEILAGNDKSKIMVFDGKTKETEWEIDLSERDLDVISIQTGNLDDDSSVEIVAALAGGLWSGGFAVIDVQTQSVEYLNISIDPTHCVLVIDHSTTSSQEILVGSNDHVLLFGFNGTDYYEIWTSPELEGEINALAWGDFDTNPDPEITAGYGMYDLDSFSYSGGITVFSDELEQKWNKTDFKDNVLSLNIYEENLFVGTGQVGDELLDYNGWLYEFSGQTMIKGTDLNTEVKAIAFGDVTGDEADEVIIGNEDTVVVFSQDMKELGRGNYYSDSGSFGNLYVVDIDEDGQNEIIVHTNSYSGGNYIYVLVPGGKTDSSSGSSSSADLLLGSMCMAVCCGIFIIDILIMIWVYRDAESRGESGAKWLIIVLFTGIIGIIIWLVVRPKTRSYGSSGYGTSSYSGGHSYNSPKGKGKIVIGTIFLIIGLVIFVFLIPQTTVTPTEYKEEYDDAEEGTEWTIHGHLDNEESMSLAGVSIYSYSFEEDEDATFTSSGDLGNDGDEVIVTVTKTSDDLNQAEASSSINPWVDNGPGVFFIAIGAIVLVIGIMQASKGAPGSAGGRKKRKRGEPDDAGNVDFTSLMGAPGGPSMDPSVPASPPTMIQQPIPPQPMPVQGMPPMVPGMQQQFPQSPHMPQQPMYPPAPMTQGPQQMQPPTVPSQIPNQFQPPVMPVQGPQQPPPQFIPTQGPQQPPPQFIPPQAPNQYQHPVLPAQGPQQQPTPVHDSMPQQPMPPQYQAGTWTCPNCGISMNAEYSFCTSCGHGKGL